MNEQTALYRLYRADGLLLYVGITDNPPERWRSHASLKPWWPEVARRDVEWFNTRAAALDAESRAILGEDPLHNIRGRGGSKVRPSLRTRHPQTRWSEWVERVAGNAAQSEISRRTGIAQTSIGRWRVGGKPTAGNIATFARAYGVKVVDALIAAGLLTEEEARVPLVVTRHLTAENLAAMSTDELIAEHRRRAEELAWRMVS
jgi:hypothetical protein